MLKNGLYNAAAGAVRIGLAILTIPVLIRLLGVEEYGLWTLASAVMGMVSLAEAGLSTATTVFVSQDLARENTDGLSQTLTVTVGAMLILATLAAIALWISAESIVSFFPKLGQPQQLAVVQALKIGGLAVWARLLQQVLIGVEQAYQHYGPMNVLNTMQATLMSLGLLAVAWQGGRTVALMQWQALASAAVLLSHIWVIKSLLYTTPIRLAWGREKGLAVARYSLMTWLSSIGSVLFTRVDRPVVGVLLGVETLGIYGAITDITGQINSFSALSVQPLLPFLSRLTPKQRSGDPYIQQQVKQALQVNGLVALGLGATLITFSPLVLNLIIPNKAVNEYILPFCIATSIYALYSVNAVGYYILLATKAINTFTAIQMISGLLSIIMIAIGAQSFGLIGAILGNSGYLMTLLLTFLGVKKLSISNADFVRWMGFPIVWFLIVLIINSVLNVEISFRFWVAIIQISIIIFWFIFNNSRLFYIVCRQVEKNINIK